MAFLGGALYITQGQAVDVAGINCFAIRFVEAAAFLRVLNRGELSKVRFTSVDRWLLIFFGTYVSVMLLRTGTLDKYAVGMAVDGSLVYFTFRSLIANLDEFRDFMKGTVYVLMPFTLLMLIEATTARNPFAAMGGVPEVSYFRDGNVRCSGSFRSSIGAGSMGAAFMPLFIGFLFDKPQRTWAAIGIMLSLGIVLMSHSSGPLLATIAAIAAWGCWQWRAKMRTVRWGIVGSLVGLQLVMKAPIWFIFSHISDITGGDGWHRSNLIDQFVKHFQQWWLVGMPFDNTGDWAATQMPWGGVDVTNYYVSVGIGSGLISLVFLVVMLTKCFGLLGQGLRAARQLFTMELIDEAMVWGAGCAILTHVVNFFSVVYWDQSYVIYYIHLAIAVSLSQYLLIAQLGLEPEMELNISEAKIEC